jgi:hypothetical protein
MSENQFADLMHMAPGLSLVWWSQLTDPEIGSNRCYRPPSSDQIEDSATELGWITVRHVGPSLRAPSTTDSSVPTPPKPGQTRASGKPGPIQCSRRWGCGCW